MTQREMQPKDRIQLTYIYGRDFVCTPCKGINHTDHSTMATYEGVVDVTMTVRGQEIVEPFRYYTLDTPWYCGHCGYAFWQHHESALPVSAVLEALEKEQ